MADPGSGFKSNEDQQRPRESHRGGHRGGARPRHQNYSSPRGQQHTSHPRSYHNSHGNVEGQFRSLDHSEEVPEASGDINQSYQGSKHRPYKINHVSFPHRHKKQYSGYRRQTDVVENEKLPVSNMQEDFSLLNVLDEKQKWHGNTNDTQNPVANHQDFSHSAGYHERQNISRHKNNHNEFGKSGKQDFSLLTGVEEKQQWNNNNEGNYFNKQSEPEHHRAAHHRREKWEKDGHHDRHQNGSASERHQRGRGGYSRGQDQYQGQHEQFRWYGRRNYNFYGKDGSYRAYEEPVLPLGQNTFSAEQPQLPQNFDSFSKHDRDTRKHRHQKPKHTPRNYPDIEDDATQRERLMQQLKQGDLECMVCCESVRHRDPVWSCLNCYHIFHLHCIRKWARSPTALVEGSGWRCPTCQAVKDKVPVQYLCFCGKVNDPERNYHDTPHSCGNVCGRKQADENCAHPCSLLCHPGPCPPCTALITSTCACGRVKLQIRCGKSKTLTCDETCGKDLNCRLHKCLEKCHIGQCQTCSEIVKQDCYCLKVSRDIACTETTSKSAHYSCGQSCDKLLACGNHKCDHLCHEGTCFSCRLLAENVTHCPCGRAEVMDILGGANRKSCLDPVPTCNNSCLKLLTCGPEGERHSCQVSCHLDVCPPCPLKTSVRCNCGISIKEFLCSELTPSFQFLCEKRCNKKRRCGRHKCLNNCCIDPEHLCLQICNQKLSCGLHTCQDLCHIGNCRPCLNASFEELTCICGHSVKYPPVPCGSKPPECDRLCTRSHPCDHLVQHVCHSDRECPPCTVLSEKWCYGKHEKRSHLPCFLSSLSCGLPCQKPLGCGQHQCIQICHEGPCQVDPQLCIQPCPLKRLECEHPCGAPCHPGSPCPENACKKSINVSCLCGIRNEKMPCSENTRMFRQMSASLLASKMQDIQSGTSVDISDVLSSHKKNKFNKLECNGECSVVDRNRRLALALQIRNPDLSNKPGPPTYTEFLKEETRKHPTFMKSVHDKITDLVQLSKQSKQKSRSHSFPPTNRDQRRVIHEMSEYFGCETESFDQEPKRNVVVTAFRDRSYLPSTSVMAVIQRELGQRRAPPPMMLASKESTSAKPQQLESKKECIDHFDFPQ